MWILPKQLISAFAQDTEALTSDSVELSQTCAQSLMRRSKPSPAKTYLREWKAGNLMRLRYGAISRPSLGQQFSGLVDILSGGYPCQPFSAAGLRKGTDDPRHLWPFISAGIAVMRPSLCFFENVEGHISLGLPDVIEDLGRLGYRATWGIFSAAECGAPHQRKRVFILAANSNSDGMERRWRSRFAGSIRQGWQSCQATSDSEFAAIDWASESASALIGANDGGADWMDRVRLLGNGVVPATAALAFQTLLNGLRIRYPTSESR